MLFLHHFDNVDLNRNNYHMVVNVDEGGDYHHIEGFVYSEIEKYALYDGWYLRKIKEFNTPSLFNLNKYFVKEKTYYCGSSCNVNQNDVLHRMSFQLSNGDFFGRGYEKYLLVKVKGLESSDNVTEIMEAQIRYLYQQLLITRRVQIKNWILEGVEPGLAVSTDGDYRDRVMNSFSWNDLQTVEKLNIKYLQDMVQKETFYYLVFKKLFFSLVLGVFVTLVADKLFFANDENL